MWPHWTWFGGRGEYIGIGIASYINLLDPEKIVLAGGMSNESLLIGQIQKVVKIRRDALCRAQGQAAGVQSG